MGKTLRGIIGFFAFQLVGAGINWIVTKILDKLAAAPSMRGIRQSFTPVAFWTITGIFFAAGVIYAILTLRRPTRLGITIGPDSTVENLVISRNLLEDGTQIDVQGRVTNLFIVGNEER